MEDENLNGGHESSSLSKFWMKYLVILVLNIISFFEYNYAQKVMILTYIHKMGF